MILATLNENKKGICLAGGNVGRKNHDFRSLPVRHKYAPNLYMTAIDRKKLDPDLKSNLYPTILVYPVLDPQHSSAKWSSRSGKNPVRIKIRSGFNWVSGFGSRQAKIVPPIRKNFNA